MNFYVNSSHDKDSYLESIKLDAFEYRFANNEIKNNREVVLEAVRNNGYILEYVPPKFQDDKEIVMEAVSNRGSSLEYASDGLKDNKKIVSSAIKSDNLYLEHVLLVNRLRYHELCPNYTYALEHASKKYQKNRYFNKYQCIMKKFLEICIVPKKFDILLKYF